MSEALRIALCDDHAIVRSGLRRILEAEEDFTVVGEAGTVAEAIDLAQSTEPDVFVMDVGLPDGSGIDAAAHIRKASTKVRVLVLTMHEDIAYLRRAFEAGINGYLLKEAADAELVAAIRRIADGQQYVHPTLGAALLAPDAPTVRPSGPGGELSDRETEVLELLASGLTNTEVAERLFVSVRTVETHRAHINQKLDVKTRAQLVKVAREAGLLGEEDR